MVVRYVGIGTRKKHHEAHHLVRCLVDCET